MRLSAAAPAGAAMRSGTGDVGEGQVTRAQTMLARMPIPSTKSRSALLGANLVVGHDQIDGGHAERLSQFPEGDNGRITEAGLKA